MLRLRGWQRAPRWYLALIGKRTAERDVWAEQSTLKAERHTTKMMLHDILDKHIPKKPVD
jgi:hypothetical protein